jgi:hypothetical protein
VGRPAVSCRRHQLEHQKCPEDCPRRRTLDQYLHDRSLLDSGGRLVPASPSPPPSSSPAVVPLTRTGLVDNPGTQVSTLQVNSTSTIIPSTLTTAEYSSAPLAPKFPFYSPSYATRPSLTLPNQNPPNTNTKFSNQVAPQIVPNAETAIVDPSLSSIFDLTNLGNLSCELSQLPTVTVNKIMQQERPSPICLYSSPLLYPTQPYGEGFENSHWCGPRESAFSINFHSNIQAGIFPLCFSHILFLLFSYLFTLLFIYFIIYLLYLFACRKHSKASTLAKTGLVCTATTNSFCFHPPTPLH